MTKRLLHAGMSLALLIGLCGPALIADDGPVTVSAARNTPIVRAIERARRSSVNIHSEKRRKASDVLFSATKDQKVNGMGTGIIVDERGYIVTNYHVIADVDALRVTLCDNTTYDARTISFDSHQDLAIIKIEAPQQLPVMPMGTSSDLMLGEDVIAIGNAFGYTDTVTRGIISALGRDVEVNDEQSYSNLIQIDAAINPGNSGGPLLNADGELIGINVAIRAGAQRIGFAIPINDARNVVARLLNIERLNSHYHGLLTGDVKKGHELQLAVQGTLPNSPAAAAGLQNGDIVIHAGTVAVLDSADFERALLGRATGDKVDVQVRRNGDLRTVTLEVAALPADRATSGRPSVPVTTPAPTSQVAADSTDRSWQVLGLRLAKLPAGDQTLAGRPYRGGLLVTDVRDASPAYQNGIRKGDVLVGLHVWETVNSDNVDYVVNHPQFSTFNPLKFYILRGGETLYGHLPVVVATSSTK